MLVSEFKKRIKNIDSHLYVEVGDGLPAMIKVKYSLINDNPLPRYDYWYKWGLRYM